MAPDQQLQQTKGVLCLAVQDTQTHTRTHANRHKQSCHVGARFHEVPSADVACRGPAHVKAAVLEEMWPFDFPLGLAMLPLDLAMFPLDLAMFPLDLAMFPLDLAMLPLDQRGATAYGAKT